MRMDKRVKFYSRNDLLFGHNFSKIETMRIPRFEEIDINDAIEFFQIEKYFDGGVRCKSWTDEDFVAYMGKCKELSGLTKRFFNQINNDNIVNIYDDVEVEYRSDFWVLFDNCKLYEKISADIFVTLINGVKVFPNDLFLHRRIVEKYGAELRDYILGGERCVPVLLRVYEQGYTQEAKLFLPSELTKEDICNYFEAYIDGDKPNANHLRTIYEMNSPAQFAVTDEIRLKAKRRYELELKEMEKRSASISYEIQLKFDQEQDEVKLFSNKDHGFEISYSTKWLKETLDYPSILNNFIYLFEFVDVPQMRSNHVNRVSQSGIFERIFSSKSSRVYPINSAYESAQGLALLQTSAYYGFLESQDIRLEEVLEWFFTKYLQGEFSCAELRVSMPTYSSSNAEKCSSILTAFESVLKQYSLFVKHGEIDFELIRMSTQPVLLSNVKSMIPNKYVYGRGEDYKHLTYWLFSDQCTFSYVERLYNEGKTYDAFFDLLRYETIFLSDYREEDRGAFEMMESFDLVSIGDDGKITPKNVIKLSVLYDLFKNDVISLKHCSPNVREIISDFEERGVVELDSTLFSRPEINYLNYLLNHAEYSNGLEIRNKYIHGISQVSNDENEHRNNYYILLRLFVLLAIKINDEFCLKETENADENVLCRDC